MFGGGQPFAIEVPKLEPKDLYDRRRRRDHARLRSYNILLQQIYHRVYSSSQLPVSSCSVLYTVPPFIIGLPKLDMEDCIVYIVFQLRQAGFEVKFTWPNILFISWKHHEGAYLTNQNPIVQAMLRESESNTRAQQKLQQHQQKQKPAKKDVTFNDAIELLTKGAATPSVASSQGAPFGAAPRRAPSDYKPPESFLQTMDRPGPGRTVNPISGAPQTKPDVLADLWTL